MRSDESDLPRLSGPSEDADWTIMFVPERGRGRVIQWTISLKSIRRGLIVASMLAALLVVGTGWLVAGLPVVWSYDDLLQENLALKGTIRDIEGQLQSVEVALKRIEVLDAQLREYSDSPVRVGGTGPIEDEEYALLTGEGSQVALSGSDLRPAELWARAVEARSTDLMARLEVVEPSLNDLSQDLADMMSIQSAMPQQWPLMGILSSGFGYRKSPIRRSWNFHPGIDVSAPRGSKIYAVAPGKVIESEYQGGYGRMLLIDHGYGIQTRYAHNTSLFVKAGDFVEPGQVIATVGTTGQTTGPHLHFEMLVDGRTVDPLDYLPR